MEWPKQLKFPVTMFSYRQVKQTVWVHNRLVVLNLKWHQGVLLTQSVSSRNGYVLLECKRDFQNITSSQSSLLISQWECLLGLRKWSQQDVSANGEKGSSRIQVAPCSLLKESTGISLAECNNNKKPIYIHYDFVR